MLDDLLPSAAPTAYPILLQPYVHGLDLINACSSLLVHLVVVLRGRKHAQVSAKFCSPSTSCPFVTPSRPGIICDPNHSNASHNIHPTSTLTQLPRTPMHAHHPSQQVSQSKIQAKFISPTASPKKTNRHHFKPRQVPRGTYRPYETCTLYPVTCPLQKFQHKA